MMPDAVAIRVARRHPDRRIAQMFASVMDVGHPAAEVWRVLNIDVDGAEFASLASWAMEDAEEEEFRNDHAAGMVFGRVEGAICAAEDAAHRYGGATSLRAKRPGSFVLIDARVASTLEAALHQRAPLPPEQSPAFQVGYRDGFRDAFVETKTALDHVFTFFFGGVVTGDYYPTAESREWDLAQIRGPDPVDVANGRVRFGTPGKVSGRYHPI